MEIIVDGGQAGNKDGSWVETGEAGQKVRLSL